MSKTTTRRRTGPDWSFRAQRIMDAAQSLAELAQLNRRVCAMSGERWDLFEDVVGEHIERLQRLLDD